MACNLQLQRNTKLFYSTVDLASGATSDAMTPGNTWQIEVLAGYALAQSTATQDITPIESGLTPDRGVTRFNTAINPVEWNFQAYLRPTGLESIKADGDGTGGTSGNVKPLADWFLWQAALGNVAPASGEGASVVEQSAWEDTGVYRSVVRAASENVAPQSPNFAVAQENHLYFKLDNVFYQVANASINEAAVDAAIDSIATTTWTGFGTELVELRGLARNNAVSVFGGILNDGSEVSPNSNFEAIGAETAYHPWETWNNEGVTTSAAFIKNRLSTIDLNHKPEGASVVNYVFPVTSLSWTLNNDITFLTPEELSSLNTSIGNFAGARTISSEMAAYLRHGDTNSAQFLRNILADTRTSHSTDANANVQIGGVTAPYVAFFMPAVQFELPTHAIEDIISVSIVLQAQESLDNCGLGDEVTIFVKK